MAESILKIHTQNGDIPVGYPGLANKPIADKTLSEEGAFADSKAVGDKFKEVKTETNSLKEEKADKTDLDTERKRIDVLNDGGLNLKDEVIDTSIKAWLEEHPEATTTVQDGSLTAQKLNAISFGKAVNVLFLGIKNDGSEDCSDIINEWGKNYSLYFPAGKYLIKKEIKLSYSLLGESNTLTYGNSSLTTLIVNVTQNLSTDEGSGSIVFNGGAP